MIVFRSKHPFSLSRTLQVPYWGRSPGPKCSERYIPSSLFNPQKDRATPWGMKIVRTTTNSRRGRRTCTVDDEKGSKEEERFD